MRAQSSHKGRETLLSDFHCFAFVDVVDFAFALPFAFFLGFKKAAAAAWAKQGDDPRTRKPYVWMYEYIYIHICMHACMYVCMYVCMYGWMDGWMDGWM